MNRNLILAAAGALGVILVAVALNQGWMPGMGPPTAPEAREHAGPAAERAKAMVARAVAHQGDCGMADLIETINTDAAPEYRDGEFYVFVLDRAGTIVGHPIDPRLVGTTDAAGRDADGNTFLGRMAAAAAENPNGSWFDYRWPNPVTGQADDKSSWVVMRDDHVIGVGIYLGGD